MTRSWLFLRVTAAPEPDHDRERAAVTTAVPSVAESVRAVDPDCHWSFQRLPDHGGVGLWWHVPTALVDGLRLCLRAVLPAPFWRLEQDDPDRFGEYALRHRDAAARALSAAGTELALSLLRADGLAGDSLLPFAVTHLRHIADLVAPADRPAFLFCCWQHWTAGMSPAYRVARVRGASAAPADRLATGVPWDGPGWHRYLDAVRAAVADSGTLTNLLLFDHTHLTHNRLGIPPEVAGTAVALVRASLAARPVPALAG